jgi:hypothetical protein
LHKPSVGKGQKRLRGDEDTSFEFDFLYDKHQSPNENRETPGKSKEILTLLVDRLQ